MTFNVSLPLKQRWQNLLSLSVDVTIQTKKPVRNRCDITQKGRGFSARHSSCSSTFHHYAGCNGGVALFVVLLVETTETSQYSSNTAFTLTRTAEERDFKSAPAISSSQEECVVFFSSRYQTG